MSTSLEVPDRTSPMRDGLEAAVGSNQMITEQALKSLASHLVEADEAEALRAAQDLNNYALSREDAAFVRMQQVTRPLLVLLSQANARSDSASQELQEQHIALAQLVAKLASLDTQFRSQLISLDFVQIVADALARYDPHCDACFVQQ